VLPAKRKEPPFLGRRLFGLLLLQTPGLAERRVGRPSRFRDYSGIYHRTVRLRTDMRGFLRSSFFAGSAFLLFFTGFAVGFMAFHPSRSNFGVPYLADYHEQSVFQTKRCPPWSNEGT